MSQQVESPTFALPRNATFTNYMSTSTTPGTLRYLVIGSQGQIGQELVQSLIQKHGPGQVIASDIREPQSPLACPFTLLDVGDKERLYEVIDTQEVDVVFNLAAILSAKGEKDPLWAWDINMKALLNTLEALRETRLQRLFWPSSIAVFGPSSPKVETPQSTVMDPNTVYGISKLAGERWCDYYREKYGCDVRSLRYPGLIGYKSNPGGGTTDYAVDIFHQALRLGQYVCFLQKDTRLPMMYMEDAIRATMQVTDAPLSAMKTPGSYNLSGMSFSPAELAAEIQKHIPHFEASYAPDFRQAIADSWPQSIDDTVARRDWGWNAEIDMPKLVSEMLSHLQVLQV